MSVKINARLIRQLLAEKNIDQRTLSKLSGVSEPTITRVMHGKPFSSDTLGSLAAALDCNPRDLIEAPGHVDPLVVAPVA